LKKLIFLSFILANSCIYPLCFAGEIYRKASEDDEVVKNKKYLKESKIELGLPSLGYILNQSFVDTFLLQGNLTYYITEWVGISLNVTYALNSDRDERYCLEHFINDPLKLTTPCTFPGEDPTKPLFKDDVPVPAASLGPVYMPIRELNTIFLAGATLTPIYGKQLAFLSFVNYFDIYSHIEGGLTTSTFYPETQFLRNGKLARGIPGETKGCPPSPGVCPDESSEYLNLIGVNGRPDPLIQTNPTFSFAIGQKFHILSRFHFKMELRTYTILAEETHNYLAFSTGVGLRF
jgi:hypothetical protein